MPSLPSTSSQPLETLTAYQPDGGNGTYRYAAGTSAPEIGQITAEFSDGTTAQAIVSRGTFILIYPPDKLLAALRPAVPKFPDLRCSVVALQAPAIPGGPPGFTTYTDGGCTGYTVKFKPVRVGVWRLRRGGSAVGAHPATNRPGSTHPSAVVLAFLSSDRWN